MLARSTVLAAVLSGAVSGIELTPANWDKETSGKTVFIKFLAPCTTSLIADVDCTAAGEPLCKKNGVQGYPSIKYGAPGKLKDYQGGRDFASLKAFADKNLGPDCGPDNLKGCDKKTKEKYKEYMAMDSSAVEAKIREKRKAFEVIQKEYDEEMAVMKPASKWLRKQDRDKKAAEKAADKKKKKEEEAAKKAAEKGSKEKKEL